MTIHTFPDAAQVRAALLGEKPAEVGLEALARIEGHVGACVGIDLERVRRIKSLEARVAALEDRIADILGPEPEGGER